MPVRKSKTQNQIIAPDVSENNVSRSTPNSTSLPVKAKGRAKKPTSSDKAQSSIASFFPVVELSDEKQKEAIETVVVSDPIVEVVEPKRGKGRPKKKTEPVEEVNVEEKYESEEEESEDDISKIDYSSKVRILNLLITINAPIGIIIQANKIIAEDVYRIVSDERSNEYGILSFEECKGSKKGTDHIHLYLKLKAGSVISKLCSQRISFKICDYFKIDKNNWTKAVDFKVIKKCTTAVGYVLKTIGDVFPSIVDNSKVSRHYIFEGNMLLTTELKNEIVRQKNEYRPNLGAQYSIKNVGPNPDEWIHGAYQWMRVKGYALCMNTGKIINKTSYINEKYKEMDFYDDFNMNYLDGNNKWTQKKQKEFFSYLKDRTVPYTKRPIMRANKHLIGFKDGLLHLDKENVYFEKNDKWLDTLDKDWPCYMANEEFNPRFPNSIIELMGDHMGIETIWAMIHADRKILWFDSEHKIGSMQILYGHSNAGKTTITMPWEIVWGKFGLYYQLPNSTGQFAFEALRDNPECVLMCLPDGRIPKDPDALNTMKTIGEGRQFDLPVKGGTKLEVGGKACKILMNSSKPPLDPSDVDQNAILTRSHVFELNSVTKMRFESEQAGRLAVIRDAVYYFLLLADLDNKYITVDMIPEKYKRNESSIQLSTKGYVNGSGVRLLTDKSSQERYKKENEDHFKCKIGVDEFESDSDFEVDYKYIEPVD